MNDVENYKTILEEIFGQEIAFSNYKVTNNCIGALRSTENFSIFKINFIERLKRLQSYFSGSQKHLKEIIDTAKQIACGTGYKWAGPYSELVALDYWTKFENLREIAFPDKGPVDNYADSIAKIIGQTEIDIDISFKLSTKKIYTDVKCLIPTHKELTDQILRSLKKRIKGIDFLIGIDNLYDVDYLRTKSDLIHEIQSGELINALEKCVNDKDNHYSHKLKSGEEVSFRIAYAEKPGEKIVLTTMKEINPFRLAENYKYKILDYYNKFLISEPSLITFVINPWFNEEIILHDHKFTHAFLRSLSRRVFIELIRDERDLSVLHPELSGKGIKISTIASKVTGIVFIMDRSVLKSGEDINDVHIYLNPKATNRLLTWNDFDILSWSAGAIHPLIDDFANDNY